MFVRVTLGMMNIMCDGFIEHIPLLANFLVSIIFEHMKLGGPIHICSSHSLKFIVEGMLQQPLTE